MITYALGGRAAEKLIFQRADDGRGQRHRARHGDRPQDGVRVGDERQAWTARLRRRRTRRSSSGRQITRHRNYSEDTAIAIDEEIKKIVTSGMKRAEKILTDNIDTLHRLAAALLEREILDASEIDTIIRGEDASAGEKQENGEKAICRKPPAPAAGGREPHSSRNERLPRASRRAMRPR